MFVFNFKRFYDAERHLMYTSKKLKHDVDLIPIQCLLKFEAANVITTRLSSTVGNSFARGIEPVGYIRAICNLRDEDQGYRPRMTVPWYRRGYRTVLSYHDTQNLGIITADGSLVGNHFYGYLKQAQTERALYNLCVKREYVEYFYQALLLGDIIDDRIFTLVIDEQFDTKDTYAPRIRPPFRKYIRKEFLQREIEIVYKSNLDNYFYTDFKLKASTPMELNKIKKDLVQELLTI